jgi:hypothetical protein
VIVIGRGFVAGSESIVLQADEVADLKYFGSKLGVRILLLLLLRDSERSLASSRAFLSCSARDSADSELRRGGTTRSEMPRGGTI